MGKRLLNNIVGQKYGKLTILKELEPILKNGTRKRIVLCKCECGNIIETQLYYLTDGHKNSCGCLLKTKKGYGNTKLCKVWNGMHRRCENKKSDAYSNYGGRGIKVCNEWSGEDGFYKFREWALSNGYQEGLTIDRIDGNGNYEPGNCRWATYKEQNNNLRSNHNIEYNGETHTISEWSEITGISQSLILARISKLNYSIGEALGFEVHNPKYRDMKKVLQLNKENGEVIAEYKSIGEASKLTHVDRSSISRCCNGIVKTAGGYKWALA